ncbi:hypothetical protein [Vibrio sp. B1REV9]|nr:hypothetical protein [Vibrio sp. B1REV9]
MNITTDFSGGHAQTSKNVFFRHLLTEIVLHADPKQCCHGGGKDE